MAGARRKGKEKEKEKEEEARLKSRTFTRSEDTVEGRKMVHPRALGPPKKDTRL